VPIQSIRFILTQPNVLDSAEDDEYHLDDHIVKVDVAVHIGHEPARLEGREALE